jgi:hypothetical protein
MNGTRKTLMTLLFGVLILWPLAAHAQTPGLIVIHSAAEGRGDSLDLSVYFTVVNPEGQPVPRDEINVEEATIELLGGDKPPVEAGVGDPGTPFYIVLLLDGSGSMANVIGEVREAAKEALDGAPPNAYFSVVKFNELAIDEDLRPIENFTNDLVLVKSAIDAVTSDPNAPTCLYNATYRAIEMLDRQITGPQERKAIILFTDGKDERGDGTPCSQRKYDDVIYRATRGGPSLTPIHTIGLCDASCGNLNQAELRTMASDTLGFSAIGGRENLGGLFERIIDGLSSQLVARAKLYPNQGENLAALSLKLRDIAAPVSTTFNFFSDRDYDVPPPPVTSKITSLVYDDEQDVYNLALSVTSSEQLQQVIVEVWDEKNGTQVPPAQIFENPEATLQFERNSDGLIAGREYSFRVKALDKQGFLVTIGEEQETMLDVAEFVYEPPQRESVAFRIKSAQANYSAKQLTIDVDVLATDQINTYEGFIVDKDTGAGIHDFEPALFPADRRIQIELPPTIQQAQAAREYRLTLFLVTKDGLRLEAEPYEFTAVPPPPPGLLVRIWVALSNNLAVVASIVVITVCAIGVIVLWQRPARKENLPPPLPRPPVDQTVIAPLAPEALAGAQRPVALAAAKAQPGQPLRLRLKVLKTSMAIPESEKVTSHFPLTLGREGCDLNFPEDRHISRRHAEFSVRGNQVYVTDLGSRNGTFIGDQQVTPNQPTPLDGAKHVRLGKRTFLQVDLL